MSKPDFYVEVYRGKSQGRQAWRWRALNVGNNRKMATGGESYTNKGDCISAATALFDGGKTVHMRHANGEAVLRTGRPEVPCEHCGHDVTLHEDGCQRCECVKSWYWT